MTWAPASRIMIVLFNFALWCHAKGIFYATFMKRKCFAVKTTFRLIENRINMPSLFPSSSLWRFVSLNRLYDVSRGLWYTIARTFVYAKESRLWRVSMRRLKSNPTSSVTPYHGYHYLQWRDIDSCYKCYWLVNNKLSTDLSQIWLYKISE